MQTKAFALPSLSLLLFSLLTACQAPTYPPITSEVESALREYAAFLRTSNRTEDAQKVSEQAERFRKSTEEAAVSGSAYMGFNPSAVLSSYSRDLEAAGQSEKAKTMAELSNRWMAANVRGAIRAGKSRGPSGWEKYR